MFGVLLDVVQDMEDRVQLSLDLLKHPLEEVLVVVDQLNSDKQLCLELVGLLVSEVDYLGVNLHIHQLEKREGILNSYLFPFTPETKKPKIQGGMFLEVLDVIGRFVLLWDIDREELIPVAD